MFLRKDMNSFICSFIDANIYLSFYYMPQTVLNTKYFGGQMQHIKLPDIRLNLSFK